MKCITIIVFGQAQSAGSKRAFSLKRRDGSLVTRANGSPVINVTDDNAKSRGWKNQVAAAARQAYRGELLRGPVDVVMVFYRPRPGGHFGKAGLNKKGRETPAPVSKPDVLKLARGVEDALTSIVWRDDAQIVAEILTKEYGEPARVEVRVSRLIPPTNLSA